MNIYEQLDVFLTKLGEMRGLAEQIKNPEARASLLEEYTRIEAQTQELRTRIPDAMRKPEPEAEAAAVAEDAAEAPPVPEMPAPPPLQTLVDEAVAALLALGGNVIDDDRII